MAEFGSLYGGYIARQKMNQDTETQNLGQLVAGQGLLARIQAQQDQDRLRQLVGQSGGDPKKAMEALVAAGTPQSLELAAKLHSLIPDPSQAALRQAQTLKAQVDAAQGASQLQGQRGLAQLLNPQSPDYTQGSQPNQMFTTPDAARDALVRAEQEGRPFSGVSPNQGSLQGLLAQANPAAFVRGQMTSMNRPPERPQVVPAGAGLRLPGEQTPSYTQPFAPRAPEALVPVVTPNGPRYATRSDAIGQPVPQPPSATRDPKAQAAYTAGLKEVQKDEAAVSATAQLENAFNRWSELNSQVTTGRATGYRPAIMQPLLQEMQQLQNYLAVNNFKPGQGQISNFERQLIKGAGPSVLNDKETNDNIIKVQLGAVANIRDRAEYRQWYLETKGNLLGSDRAWNEYLEKNPRYTKGVKGGVVPNEARKAWSEYFGVGASSAPASPGAIPSNSIIDQADAILNGNR